jgi:HAL2 family 3'(2'),5'-bisphosphate nucleotidase
MPRVLLLTLAMVLCQQSIFLHLRVYGRKFGASSNRHKTAFVASKSFQRHQRTPTIENPLHVRMMSASTIQQESLFPQQVQIALQTIRKACQETSKVQDQIQITKDEITQTKHDATPVTVADYAAQAIILKQLKETFPEDLFLAEETSAGLKEEPGLIPHIQELTGLTSSESALFDAIDIGQTYHIRQQEKNDNTPPGRVWCLDPIDGTKGFLRKGQYCVALALLENGIPTIGILACPNLPACEGKNNGKGNGCIFVALKGEGCYEIGMEPNSYLQRLGYREDAKQFEDPNQARFCVAVEQGFNDPVGTTIAMGKTLHGALDDNGEIKYVARMDSQVKYGVIARGDAEFYVRLPKDHKDNIWDVAAGVVCLEEVGGKVTDTEGTPLDFSVGAKLPTVGILGARTSKLHDSLLKAYQQATKN